MNGATSWPLCTLLGNLSLSSHAMGCKWCPSHAPTVTLKEITGLYCDPAAPVVGAADFWIDTSSTSKISVAFGPMSPGPGAP